MRQELVMAALLAACTPPPGGHDKDGHDHEPPDTDVPPSCDPTKPPVDTVALDVAPLPNNPLGRTLTVTMEEAAGATVTCTLDAAPPVWRELVPPNASWRYTYASDPGPSFADPSFDDASWTLAPGPFGREDEGATMIAPADLEAPPVVWFRTTFDVADPAAVESILFGVRRDDGVVVYLNGTEIARDNVPAVLRMSADDERILFEFPVDPSLLVAGENVLAAELHQSGASTDAGFSVRFAAEIDELLPEQHVLRSDEPATTHTFDLYGLLADATYTCAAASTGCGGTPTTSTVATDPLPVTVPMAVPAGLEDPDAGYVLFNHSRPCGGDRSNRLFIADPDGRIRWWYELPIDGDSTIDIEAQLLADGTIYWGGGDDPAGIPQIVDLAGETVYTSGYPGVEEETYHHDVEKRADGAFLGIVDRRATDGVDSWTGFELVEHDPVTDEVVWRWNAQEAFDRGELEAPSPGESDPWHANSLASVEDVDGPAVYVSLFDTMEIVRVDRTTGVVTWHLGLGRDFTLESGVWFDHMHSIDVFPGPNGEDRLFVYDNGNSRGVSRVMALDLDAPNRTARIDWEWTEPTWYEPNWGDADQTDHGTVFVTMSHAHCLGGSPDHLGAFVEVEQATGDVVHRLNFLDRDDSTYRGHLIDGCDLFANDRYCSGSPQ